MASIPLAAQRMLLPLWFLNAWLLLRLLAFLQPFLTIFVFALVLALLLEALPSWLDSSAGLLNQIQERAGIPPESTGPPTALRGVAGRLSGMAGGLMSLLPGLLTAGAGSGAGGLPHRDSHGVPPAGRGLPSGLWWGSPSAWPAWCSSWGRWPRWGGSLFLMVHDAGMGLAVFVIAFLLGQIVDNVVVPRVMGNLVGMNPLWLLLTVFLGGKVAGIPGILVSIPIASTIGAIAEDWLTERQPPTP